MFIINVYKCLNLIKSEFDANIIDFNIIFFEKF